MGARGVLGEKVEREVFPFHTFIYLFIKKQLSNKIFYFIYSKKFFGKIKISV